MNSRWRLAAGAKPILHEWQGEYVVHHAMSNDTHHLSATAGRVLSAMLAAGDPCVQDLARSLAIADDEIHANLVVLSELCLVTQC